VARPPLRVLRIANPVVRGVLGSPLHRLLSGALVVLEYRGRRTGRRYRIPLQYAETARGTIVVLAVRPERKLWWRSFARPAPAVVLVAGEKRAMTGRLLDGEERREALVAYLARFPRAAGALSLGRDAIDDALDGAPAAVVGLDPA
jgi:F420H(2)-dependent quinone reductase